MTDRLSINRRTEIVDALVENVTDNLLQFALQDLDSLREYVSQAERFEDLDDDTLINLYESAYNVLLDEEGKEIK